MERIRLSLTVTGLIDRLPDIFSATMVKHGKPAPDLFLHAAREMAGRRRHICLVIEDSPAGIAAAKAAGMTVFAFTGGSHADLQRLSRRTSTGFRLTCVFDDMRGFDTPCPQSKSGRDAGLMRDHVVAVDIGTGSARAGVFDRRGQLLAQAPSIRSR